MSHSVCHAASPIAEQQKQQQQQQQQQQQVLLNSLTVREPLRPSLTLIVTMQSTLMRAISNGQVDGFPPPEELRTVYVEHDIDASESEQAVLDFIHNDPTLQGTVSVAAQSFSQVRLLAAHSWLSWSSNGSVYSKQEE